jgi:hypothetical protein
MFTMNIAPTSVKNHRVYTFTCIIDVISRRLSRNTKFLKVVKEPLTDDDDDVFV